MTDSMEDFRIQELAPGVWRISYPLKLLGLPVGRNVTLLGLPGGRLLIHSTAAFGPDEVAAIRRLGEPVALLEANCFHDTFAREGREAFPDLPYFAPAGFPKGEALGARSPESAAELMQGAVEIRPIEGMPKVNEHAVYHPASKTLVLADLCFNFREPMPAAKRLFFRTVAGIRHYPGTSRFFRWMIRDRSAVEASLARILDWDFDRVVFAHGAPLETDAKSVLQQALKEAGLFAG